jgi:hypothetical protein
MSTSYATVRRVVFAVIIGLSTCAVTSAQTERVIYSFTDGDDGGYPQGGLVSDGKGNFYGTATGGGRAAEASSLNLAQTPTGGLSR